MNKNIIIAVALVTVALASGIVLCTAPEFALSRLLGKAAWYVPYAAIVGAVKAFRFGF